MATWGAYFSSHVKKNGSNGETQAHEVSDKTSPFIIKPYKTELNIGSSQVSKPLRLTSKANIQSKDSSGLKRSETRAKKLYTSPAESTTTVNELHQRSNSNAARVAKMFGYVSPAPAPGLTDVVSNALQTAQAVPKSEEKIQSAPATSSSPVLVAVKAVQAVREPNMEEKTQSLESLPGLPNSPTQVNVDAVQLEPRKVGKTEQPIPLISPLRKLPTGSVLPNRPQHSQDREKLATQILIAQGKAKVVKVGNPSISSLDEIMNLLENEAFGPSQARDSSHTEKKKAAVRDSMRKRAKAGKPSISSLDDMMSLLEQDWDVRSSGREDLVLNQSPPPVEAKFPEQDSSNLPAYTEEQEKGFAAKKLLEYTGEAGEVTVDVDVNTSSNRKYLFISPESFTSLESKLVVDIPEDTKAQIEAEGTESTEKPILDYMKEVEEMKIEREWMELERQQILEEQLAFQREADRFAEEEEQMRRFVEDLKREEERDFENQERKRRIAEGKRIKEEEERKRLQNLEDERLAIEMAERLNEENERIENERRERVARIYQERVDMERLRYVEEEARLKAQRMEDESIVREEEMREERLRYEEDQRMDSEEVTKRQRRAEEERAERARYEEEAQRIEDEQIARERRRAAKEKAERLRYEEEEVRRDFQRRENGRIAQERRRVEKQRVERRRYQEEPSALEAQRRGDERTERLRYEEEAFEPEVLTKEQELQKAEEKIRAAFAGLAQERDQLSKGVKPAVRGPRVETGALDVGVERGRGVSRYNTVGGGARARQENPRGVSRVSTVGVRSNKSISGGLPSGPKAGGLRAGPRPRGQI